MIQDAKSPNPRFKGLIHGTRTIIAEEGIFGIYRGLLPVVC
jgi:solute carrier family 25 (mitochondrial citrate transporter), member 1